VEETSETDSPIRASCYMRRNFSSGFRLTCDTSGPEYFAPVKRLPQIYEVPRNCIQCKGIQYAHKTKDWRSVYCVTKMLTSDELNRLMQITEKYLPKIIRFTYVLKRHMLLNS
jgi:hypothetical protein